MTNETWRAVPEWEGWYEVSDLGRIKRVAPAKYGTHVGHILSPHRIKSGYRMTWLCRSPTDRKYVRVCRLVLRAFAGEPPSESHQANHKNGDKADDRLCNLEWSTPRENVRHAYDVLGIQKPRGEQHHSAKLTAERIAEARRMVAEGWRHREIAERFGVSRPTITAALAGRNWKHVA